MSRYECFLCPKTYQSIDDVKRHLKKIHGLEIKVKDAEPKPTDSPSAAQRSSEATGK